MNVHNVTGLRESLEGLATEELQALLFGSVVPKEAQAETFWEMLQRWSKSVVEYFSWEDTFVKSAYAFDTDNLGLQKVHDAVVELGVTEPVVPMWLPDGYEIAEIEFKNTPAQNGIWAVFFCGDDEIVYQINVFHGEAAHRYYKDDTHYETYEQEGATFNVARNDERWTVVWTQDNIECSIFADCEEDDLRKMLSSIYKMEDS